MTESSVDTTILQVKGVTMATKVFRHCIFILDELLSCYDCYQFLAPVPLTAVVYHTEIKQPMDFRTLENNLYENKYKEYKDFAQDLCLIWDNAKLFHRSFDMIYQQAENLCKRYLSLEDFINGGPKPFYLASPESDLDIILDSPLPEEKMSSLVQPTVVFPMYKELDPPNKSNLYFVQALSEQDCATKKLRGFSNVRLLFQHLNASFFKYVAEPQNTSVPLPRFYIAKNRTLLNEAGMDPDGALAILYNVKIKPLTKELYKLQATVVISEPMGETHGFDESSMDKSNEYEFCPKAWLKLRVIKVIENVSAVINADMDRSFFKKVYNTYKLSTRIPADPKKVGDNEIAKEFVRSILSPTTSSSPTSTATKATSAAASSITPAHHQKVVTPPFQSKSINTVRPSRSRTTSGQKRSASPIATKNNSSTTVKEELKTNTAPVIPRVPSATLKKYGNNKSSSDAQHKSAKTLASTSSSSSLLKTKKNSSPPKSKAAAKTVETASSNSTPPSQSTSPTSSTTHHIDNSTSSLDPVLSEDSTDKPMIRLVLKPKVVSYDNDEDDIAPMEVENKILNGTQSKEDEDDESEQDKNNETRDEKKDDNNDDSNGNGAGGNHSKDNSDSEDQSVDDSSSNGSSSPPPEAEEWFTDGDEESMVSARDTISSTPPPLPTATVNSAALERFPSSATTSSSLTDNTESQLKETNVSFERYMENASKESSISRDDATKQYYINASKELWENLRNYAKEKHVPVVNISTYVDKTSSFPNAEGYFKHVYFLKEDSQKVVQTFRRMTITQRTTEIVSLLALKGLPHMGQITEVLQESHGEIIGLSMQRYQKTLKQYTHAHSHHRLTAYQKMDLIIQMLECMETIHKAGLAHRDLSEVNFMVNETTEKLRDGSPRAELFLIDFGKSVFTRSEDVRRWWIEHPKYANDEYDGELVPLTKDDLDIWCQQLPWIRSKPDHGYRLYRSVQTLPKSRTDTEDLPWLINPMAEDMYSIGTLIWKTFCETEPWYGILDTDLKGLRETVSEDYHIERALEREVSGTLSKELLLKFLKISPEQRSTATEVLAWLSNMTIQDGLIAEWEAYAPVSRQKRHAKALYRFEDEQAATAAPTTTAAADMPQRKKQKTNTTSAGYSAPSSPLLVHIPSPNAKVEFDRSDKKDTH